MLGWLARFGTAVADLGHDVVRFDPLVHKVRDFELVHVFGFRDPLTWGAIRATGASLVVTPSLSPPPKRLLSGRSSLWRGTVRVARALVQARWPPVDELMSLRCASHYLVPTAQWAEAVASAWHVGPERIVLLPGDARDAATAAARVYLRTGGGWKTPV